MPPTEIEIRPGYVRDDAFVHTIAFPPPAINLPNYVLFSSAVFGVGILRTFFQSLVLPCWIVDPPDDLECRLHYYPNPTLINADRSVEDFGVINPAIVDMDRQNVAPILRRCIRNGAYVAVIANESACGLTQMTRPRLHWSTIYGYDSDVFKMINFDRNRRLVTMDLHEDLLQRMCFDEIELAIENTPSIRKGVGLYPMFKCFYFRRSDMPTSDFIFSLKTQLDAYLSSTFSDLAQITLHNLFWHTATYGIAVHERLANHVENDPLKGLDYRLFTFLSEHKNLWISRLRYLEDAGHLSSQQARQEFQTIAHRADSAKMLAFKYMYVCDKEILPRIAAILREIQRREHEVLSDVLQELSAIR